MMSVNYQSPGRCWAEVNLSALRHNLGALQNHVGAGVGIMAVLKANAYGHGLELLAPHLAPLVKMFGVANAAEAEALHHYAPGVPVMILGPALPDERAVIVRRRWIPVVSSVAEAQSYADVAARIAQDLGTQNAPACQLHLAVDSGMGRMGVWIDEALGVATAIHALPGVRLSGIATHLPVPDEDIPWTVAQLAHWGRLLAQLREAGLVIPSIHSLNSAGTLEFGGHEKHSEGTGDLIRAGLAMYGCSPLPALQSMLRPVLTWKSRITLLRDVPAGRGISYGRTFITPCAMRVATLAVGYGDGYQRHLSNKGAEVLIGGGRCAVLGRITMDQMMVDVSHVPGVTEGDEAVIIGQQGTEEISASELAEKSGTIPWEIFTGIGLRVARRCVEG